MRLNVQAVARPTPLGLRQPQRPSVTANVAAAISTTGIEFPRKAVSDNSKTSGVNRVPRLIAVRFSSASIL